MEEVKERGQKIREEEILDYNKSKIRNDTEEQKKLRKRIIARIKK